MANGNPDPVEVWAPMFLFYSGTQTPKFTKEQVLNPSTSITFGHCKLCDDNVIGSAEEHMRMHRKELSAWLAKRRKQSETNKKKGLKTYRQEQEMLAKAEAARIIGEVGIGGSDDDA